MMVVDAFAWVIIAVFFAAIVFSLWIVYRKDSQLFVFKSVVLLIIGLAILRLVK